MSSQLIMLENNGVLKNMFNVESIDSDRGIIENDGYNFDDTSLMLYANGSYSNSFGLDTSKKILQKFNLMPLATTRVSQNRQIYIKLNVPGIHNTKEIGFYFPKRYENG